MTGAVGNVAGAPFLGAAEIALHYQSVGFVALGDRNLLAVDDHLAVAFLYSAPRNAPRCELAHGLRRGVDKHADDALVGTPVAAAHGVLEMHVFVVSHRLDDVAEARLHAALRRARVRTLGWHQRQDDDVVTAALGTDADAQPGKTAADHQDIGVDHIQRGLGALSAPPGAIGCGGACNRAGT